LSAVGVDYVTKEVRVAKFLHKVVAVGFFNGVIERYDVWKAVQIQLFEGQLVQASSFLYKHFTAWQLPRFHRFPSLEVDVRVVTEISDGKLIRPRISYCL
jgi:hypothetical protein